MTLSTYPQNFNVISSMSLVYHFTVLLQRICFIIRIPWALDLLYSSEEPTAVSLAPQWEGYQTRDGSAVVFSKKPNNYSDTGRGTTIRGHRSRYSGGHSNLWAAHSRCELSLDTKWWLLALQLPSKVLNKHHLVVVNLPRNFTPANLHIRFSFKTCTCLT